MDPAGTIEQLIRDFLVKTFVSVDSGAAELTGSTDLVELGLLDSMNVLQLVDFIEERYDFMLDPEDLFLLTTLDGIVELIMERVG